MAENKDLMSVLWSIADVLRNKMDANEYKTYILGLVFFKYLSDKYLMTAYDLLNDCEPTDLHEAQEAYEEVMKSSDAKEFIEEIKSTLHYTLEPKMTFISISNEVKNKTFTREILQNAFNRIHESDELFESLFVDVDLYSKKLGITDPQQCSTIASVIEKLSDADLIHSEGDVLGNAYEYLISQFASETGKKAGEFYTPHGPAQILCRIALLGQEDKKGLQVYDPCMGSASLLISCRKYSKHPDYIKYYGQEIMPSTFNLARMNMFLHGIKSENQHLRNADTLDADWPTEEETQFDAVTMNPPYSAHWSAAKGFLTDDRFSAYGGNLAPKSKADYAFLLHGFFHLEQTGTMAIVLPHGVLFRPDSEKAIRQILLENGSIYAIIGLPSKLFYNTHIPTCIVILKKKREGRDVLFIDASQLYEKAKKQNIMKDNHIDQVVEMYKNRMTIDKQTYLASFEEIKKNDYNLNISRYINKVEKEPEIDLQNLYENMKNTQNAIKDANLKLIDMFNQLSFIDEETKNTMDKFKNLLKDL